MIFFFRFCDLYLQLFLVIHKTVSKNAQIKSFLAKNLSRTEVG
jgi:hypothetical protein